MANATPSKELVAASSRPLVLAVLARGENYGYALLREVERLSGGALTWQEGMLYPVLHRLEREGLIEAAWRVAESGRRRKYYAITERGEAALAAERASWEAVNAALRSAWGPA
ncbi:MAG: helix-turn-helix transcriptional regulator [Truepera sp.]|nr:helix-turn-helix transcriptional regulator [Truepera sp.]